METTIEEKAIKAFNKEIAMQATHMKSIKVTRCQTEGDKVTLFDEKGKLATYSGSTGKVALTTGRF